MCEWAGTASSFGWPMTLLRCMLLKIEKKLMSESAVLERIDTLTGAGDRSYAKRSVVR